MNRIHITALLVLLAALAGFSACSGGGGSDNPTTTGRGAPATPQASCGPGSRPETGIQGRVPRADHDSGRAAQGYTCNTELVGAYTIPDAFGSVGGFKVLRYIDASGRECAYYDTTLLYPTNVFSTESGVNVMDMSDPFNPVLTTRLLTPAMLTPHESLVLSEERGILAAVTGNAAFYPGIVDVYDISQDCRNPVLQSSAPVGFLGHESGMTLDGNTFYSASPATPTLVPVDISNPMTPIPLTVANYQSHGLSLSNDGNRGYIADATGNQLVIIDTSEVQARVLNPTITEVSRLTWSPVSIPQNAIPFTRNGHPYVLEFDEFGAQSEVGAARIIDIADETNPRVISNIRLAVHNPENFDAQADDPGASNNFIGGYANHYCNIPTRVNPNIVACSMILSGLRIFDIRDPANPVEVAYFNAPAVARTSPAPFDGGNYAMSQPAFVPERKEIWYSDGWIGFFAIRVTNGAWP